MKNILFCLVLLTACSGEPLIRFADGVECPGISDQTFFDAAQSTDDRIGVPGYFESKVDFLMIRDGDVIEGVCGRRTCFTGNAVASECVADLASAVADEMVRIYNKEIKLK